MPMLAVEMEELLTVEPSMEREKPSMEREKPTDTVAPIEYIEPVVEEEQSFATRASISILFRDRSQKVSVPKQDKLVSRQDH